MYLPETRCVSWSALEAITRNRNSCIRASDHVFAYPQIKQWGSLSRSPFSFWVYVPRRELTMHLRTLRKTTRNTFPLSNFVMHLCTRTLLHTGISPRSKILTELVRSIRWLRDWYFTYCPMQQISIWFVTKFWWKIKESHQLSDTTHFSNLLVYLK